MLAIRTIIQIHEGQEGKVQLFQQINCSHLSHHHWVEFSHFSFPAHMSSSRHASAYPQGKLAFWKGSKYWYVPLFLFNYHMIWHSN